MRLNREEAMAGDEFQYNKVVETIREHEYPMLKGKREFGSSDFKADNRARCHLSRPCRHRPVLEITHGVFHGGHDV